MSWLVLTVLAVLCRAAYGILSKVMTQRVPVSSVGHSVLLSVVTVPLTFGLLPLLGDFSSRGLTEKPLALGLIMIAVPLGGLLYFVGVRRLDAGLAQIGFSSILIW